MVRFLKEEGRDLFFWIRMQQVEQARIPLKESESHLLNFTKWKDEYGLRNHGDANNGRTGKILVEDLVQNNRVIIVDEYLDCTSTLHGMHLCLSVPVVKKWESLVLKNGTFFNTFMPHTTCKSNSSSQSFRSRR